MSGLRQFVLVMGILQLLLAAAFYFGGGFVVGMAWLGATDLYAALEIHEIIDAARLAEYENGRYVGPNVLGDRMIDSQARAGYSLVRGAALSFVLSGLTMITAAIVSRPPRGSAAPAVQP